MFRSIFFSLSFFFTFIGYSVLSAQESNLHLIDIGLAKRDITPKQAIRLSGYASRSTPSVGVSQKLYVKAITFSQGSKPPQILLKADLIGIPDWLRLQVIQELKKKLSIQAQDLALSATHTHTGPHLRDVLSFMFMKDLPPEQKKVIDDYSDSLTDHFVQVALEAYKNRKPSRVFWGKGHVDFAINRRVIKNGKWSGFGVSNTSPVDHDVPILKVTDGIGKVKGVLATYACHCTGFQANLNQLHSDWAGVAEREVEKQYKDAICMVTIGCGADQNPNPRGKPEHVEAHGAQLATEIKKIIRQDLPQLKGPPQTRLGTIPLHFDEPPSRKVLEAQVAKNNRHSYAANKWLDVLKSGKELPRTLPYPIQTWIFGDELAMVFLPGEVVVDYSLRLKRELDKNRLWVHAYSNGLPCYIASRRLYDEGGYEVDGSMTYYGFPKRLAIDTEDRVSDEVIKQVPHRFYSEETLKTIPKPVPKEEALKTIRVNPKMSAELIASEPVVQDPVSLSFGLDGKLWVVEMPGYPRGIDGKGTPGGRVKLLHDDDQDGHYERSTLFLSGLSFPNSVMAYREGALVCASPEIIYAEDTDGDGRADKKETLLTGFSLWNQQHLVNGFEWGLDNWIYIANGDSGGKIRSVKTGKIVNLRSRDLRFRPESGEMELLTGQTQYGRHRDDWGHWFGNDNTRPSWHYPIEETYLRRNPYIQTPNNKVYLTDPPSTPKIYPASKTIIRLNDYDTANRITSACGHMIFRDNTLGKEFQGNSFVCEPVHNLVKREQVFHKGTSFSSRRAPEESQSEFFASTDNWSRPVSVHLGPDGAMYVVDFYRYAIEHPEWIPEDWQRRLDLRDGHDKGRIYRVFPKDQKQPKNNNLQKSNLKDWTRGLESSNGWLRDAISQHLIWKKPEGLASEVRNLLTTSSSPYGRLHALAVLNATGLSIERDLSRGLTDSHWGVRKLAARLAEPQLSQSKLLEAQVIRLTQDPHPKVRFQAALSLGASSSPKAAHALGRLLIDPQSDIYMKTACLSSAMGKVGALIEGLKNHNLSDPSLLEPLLLTALGTEDQRGLELLVLKMISNSNSRSQKFGNLRIYFNALARLQKSHSDLQKIAQPELAKLLVEINQLHQSAITTFSKRNHSLELRLAACHLLLRNGFNEQESSLLLDALSASSPREIRQASLERLSGFIDGKKLGPKLLTQWNSFLPEAKSTLASYMLRRNDSLLLFLNQAKEDPSLLLALSPAQKANLLRHKADSIRRLAQTVLSSKINNNKSQLVSSYIKVLKKKGDIEKGKASFKKNCASCHQLHGEGTAIGPDLRALTDRSPQTLLTAILDPNRAVEDRYLQYQFTLNDGRIIPGMILEEGSNFLKVATTEGKVESWTRKEILNVEANGISLMPEGLESVITPDQASHLFAFINQGLTTLGRVSSFKDGSVKLSGNSARFEGKSAIFDASIQAISFVEKGDRAIWEIDSLPKGTYEIFYHGGVAATYSGNPFIMKFNNFVVKGQIEQTGSRKSMYQRKFGRIRIPTTLKNVQVEFSHELDTDQIGIREFQLVEVK